MSYKCRSTCDAFKCFPVQYMCRRTYCMLATMHLGFSSADTGYKLIVCIKRLFLKPHTSFKCTHSWSHKGTGPDCVGVLHVFLCQWTLQLYQDSTRLSADPSDSSAALISTVCEAGALQSGRSLADNAMLTRLTSLLAVSEDALCSERVSVRWHMSYKLARRNLEAEGFKAFCLFLHVGIKTSELLGDHTFGHIIHFKHVTAT